MSPMAVLSFFAAALSSFFSVRFALAYLSPHAAWPSLDYASAVTTALIFEAAKYTLLSRGFADMQSCISPVRRLGLAAFGTGMAIALVSIMASLFWLSQSHDAAQAFYRAGSVNQAEQIKQKQAKEHEASLVLERARQLGEMVSVEQAGYAEDMRTGYRTRAQNSLARISQYRDEQARLMSSYAEMQAESHTDTAGYTDTPSDTRHKGAYSHWAHAFLAVLIEAVAVVTAMLSSRSPVDVSAKTSRIPEASPPIQATETVSETIESVLEAIRLKQVLPTVRAIREKYKVGQPKARAWLVEAKKQGLF